MLAGIGVLALVVVVLSAVSVAAVLAAGKVVGESIVDTVLEAVLAVVGEADSALSFSSTSSMGYS